MFPASSILCVCEATRIDLSRKQRTSRRRTFESMRDRTCISSAINLFPYIDNSLFIRNSKQRIMGIYFCTSGDVHDTWLHTIYYVVNI